MYSRVLIIKTIIIVAGVILAIRLFYIQLLDRNYQKAAESNVVQRIIEYPYRGLITDRNGNLLVYNMPVFDLMVIPGEVVIPDTVKLLNMLNLSMEEFIMQMDKASAYSRHLPTVLITQIPNEHLAAIQEDLIEYEGFYIQPRTVREYASASLSHVLGYVGEISQGQLSRDTSNYYKSGDYIGISGIEKQYEKVLRGVRGASYRMVDVRRVAKGKFRDGAYDTASVPGQNVQITIDIELQRYAEKLMDGKVGSLVAIDPKTGEILAFVSAPHYDPSLLSGNKMGSNFGILEQDSLKPLFNRALQAMYPPGSMFKTIQSLVALQEKEVTATEQIYCKGDLIGDLARAGHYDVKRAVTYSSNNFFFILFRRMVQQGKDNSAFIDSRIGYSKWRDNVSKFGLGQKLNVDLPNETAGLLPTVDYYDRMYGKARWKFSNIYSLSIGQGEILVTPLQMANLGALLANRGYFYTPHLVKKVGENTALGFQRFDVGIDSVHYQAVLEGMEQVVTIGSGRRAFVKDLQICGKTSTVENPGYDHSGFMGFAPLNDPKIAIAVYVENAGWGGRAAAATAGLVIEKYLTGEVTRKSMEEYVLTGKFHD